MVGVDISIVAPCYNEEAALPTFFRTTKTELEKLDLSWEIVCVNDGSTDATLELLIAEARGDARVRVVDLSRNFGKEAALTAGLDWAQGRAVIPIDVDLQDPPELIGEMVAKWRQGFDMVYATRQRRGSDTLLMRMMTSLFYRTYNRLTKLPIPPHAGDFRLIDRRVVEALKRLPERNRFMKGLFSWPGFKQAEVTYDRPPRRAGSTKFGYWRLWNLALEGVTSFTTVPLRIWTYFGALIAAVAFVYALLIIVQTLIYGIDVPGYASLMVVVLFLGGVQLISLGIMGEYLGRTYDEVKQRPIYLINQVYNFDEASEAGEGAGREAAS